MKPFKTIDEQYDLLLSRGLAFTNEEKAKQYLLNNNYYNIINCYAKFFMNEQDKFLPWTNFDEITHNNLLSPLRIKYTEDMSGSTITSLEWVVINIWPYSFFDKELKSVLFKYIIEAEKHLKSIIAYRFSEMYKDIDYSYLVSTNYSSKNLLEVT